MKICIPTEKDEGLESLPYGHFGSAPYFILVDAKTEEWITIDNRNQHHVHGACLPTLGLGNRAVDAVVVGGIGRRALERLKERGIAVYRASPGTVGDNIDALALGRLAAMTSLHACSGHGSSNH